MTSTTYSNNKLSDFKQGFSLYRWTIKKYRSLAIPYSIILFFALPFIQIFAKINLRDIGTSDYQKEFIGSLYGSAFSGISVLFTLVIGLVVFSYLHNKRTLDLFGAFPVTRRAQFFARYLATLTLVVVPMVVMSIASVIISMVATPDGTAEIFKGFAWLMLSIMANLSMISVFAVCSGTVADVAVSYMAISGLWPIIIAIIMFIPQQIIPGFVGFNNMDLSIFSMFSPAQVSFWGYFGTLYKGEYDINFNVVRFVIWWILFIIACLVICYSLIKQRKNETAQNGVSFVAPQVIIRSLADFVAGALGGLLLSSIAVNDNSGSVGFVWFVVGALIGSVIAHTVLQVVYVHSFAGFKRSIIYLFAMFVCVIGAYTFLAFGGAGLDTYVPNANEVKSVTFSVSKSTNCQDSDDKSYYYAENYPICACTITETEDIENFVQLHNSVVEGVTQNIKKPYSVGNDYIEVYDLHNRYENGVEFRDFKVEYTLNNGKKIVREYNGFFCFNQETQDMLIDVISDLDYIKQTTMLFNSDDYEPVFVDYILQNDYYVSDGSVYSNSTGMIVEVDESTNATLLVNKYFGNNSIRNAELLDAIRKDVESNPELVECLGITTRLTCPIIRFEFNRKADSDISRYSYYSAEMYSIDFRFTNTIAVFEKYGIAKEYLFLNN